MTTKHPATGAHPAPDAAPFSGSAFSREVVILAASFALALFIVSSIVWGLAGFDPIDSALGKLVAIAGDAALAAIITLILWRLRNWSLGVKAIVACLLSLAAAPISGLIDWGLHIFYVWPEPAPFNPEYFAQVVIFTTSELFGWSCLYLALQYNAQVRESERRLAALREEALHAQMRALQYQVNPHFLFNTLNSIAGLVEEGQLMPARDMVLGLAGFLRRTLALDPLSDTRLADEVDLQLAYLKIEETRFSDRMTVDLEIADDVGDAQVPSLILQPLVENAIKHGIARTPGPTILIIGAAQADPETLVIWIENSVPGDDPGEKAGMGLGLANVRKRLETRFGSSTQCIVGNGSIPGRVRVKIRMPFRT
ncbi:MAG: hypothetical protein RLZZ444_2141 [Pseudomonadota bacterium]